MPLEALQMASITPMLTFKGHRESCVLSEERAGLEGNSQRSLQLRYGKLGELLAALGSLFEQFVYLAEPQHRQIRLVVCGPFDGRR